MNLHYKSYGEGHPLLILHGFLGSSGNWHTLSQNVFSEHYRVLAVDQRNHGRSPHSDVFDYEVLAEDILRFMDTHEVDDAHVLGHSMGGKVAMHLAIRYPERVSKLIVVDIAPRAYNELHTDILDALRDVKPEDYADRDEIDDALAQYIPHPRVRLFLMKNLTIDPKTKKYSWQINLESLRENYPLINEAIPEDGRYDGPTLFIRGDQSDYITDDDRPDIERHFPAARVTTVKNAGHWLHADEPEPFGRIVTAFLTEERCDVD
jgi:esterase